jgi:hypothetical protein
MSTSAPKSSFLVECRSGSNVGVHADSPGLEVHDVRVSGFPDQQVSLASMRLLRPETVQTRIVSANISHARRVSLASIAITQAGDRSNKDRLSKWLP